MYELVITPKGAQYAAEWRPHDSTIGANYFDARGYKRGVWVVLLGRSKNCVNVYEKLDGTLDFKTAAEAFTGKLVTL